MESQAPVRKGVERRDVVALEIDDLQSLGRLGPFHAEAQTGRLRCVLFRIEGAAEGVDRPGAG
jgi:hypothetical protein